MLTIGITGGIGSGKSTVCRILEKYGARHIFADDIAKEIVQPGMPAYNLIVSAFGTDILKEDGFIDRKKLGNIVFTDRKKLDLLNKITHGIVSEKIKEQIDNFRKDGANLAVVEAIVPIEHGFLDLVDTVWVVVATEAIRIDRVMKRSNMTYSEAKQRIRSQMSDEKYKSLADKVIYNDGSVEELEEIVQEVLKKCGL